MSEKDLHRQIRQLLDAKGIVYFESRMDRPTTQRKGVPDFIFAVWRRCEAWIYPVAWECKIGKGKLSSEQEETFKRLQRPPNAWQCTVIRSLDEAIAELERL